MIKLREWGRKSFLPIFERLVADETGQATVEYILILSVSVVAVSALVRKFFETFDKAVQVIGANLEKDLKTGRAPYSVWAN
jgi:Flp pilus assembly pilin Flp